jgi:hypothetical protein
VASANDGGETRRPLAVGLLDWVSPASCGAGRRATTGSGQNCYSVVEPIAAGWFAKPAVVARPLPAKS